MEVRMLLAMVEEGVRMTLDAVGMAHVKLPVTDVEASARWYARVLGMRLCMESLNTTSCAEWSSSNRSAV